MHIPPSNAEEHFNIGRDLILAGDNVSAVQFLAKAIKLEPITSQLTTSSEPSSRVWVI
jgi:hypothetical protein